ncbi:protein-L-isoaspartate(D-aspartate) O-methyltransferase [Bradyrhizobium lablabi]|uniref:Protein-L-isoaspartate O-methyltransferase n=1 Tax=Bradyrhizobium lablabi TaxID=722472 RepID=A0A1M6UN66_9BRAD|nr:protein-L-isoaspartate O-methyltransferase [Bradyrhizobium lablabi]SHK70553.1 protein-L-isoaspartate(D-aspartate) O-methyltransferase [Bradyrhizobium lablabi]
MPRKSKAGLEEIRGFFATMMAVASGSTDPRFERAFELVRREAFVGPGPWHINIYQRSVETPSADPVFLYQNVLVRLDAAKGINNGEPFLHAAWMGAVEPKPGEAVCHIGAGTGYYTAILSVLTLPGGVVRAFEIDEGLAHKARENLQPFEGVSIIQGDATRLPLPPSDLIYVNAGVVTPPPSWLKALRPQGRLIFPWRPSPAVGLAIIVSRCDAGFSVKPLMASYFIPCVGAADAGECEKIPDNGEAWSARSLWLTADREPDDTAVAICGELWFSSDEISAEAGGS